MQIFVSDKGFVYVVPMKSKGEFTDALHMFAKEIGVPLAIICDPSGEQTSAKSKKLVQQIGTTLRLLEEGTRRDGQVGAAAAAAAGERHGVERHCRR